jgi:hypothetical protein
MLFAAVPRRGLEKSLGRTLVRLMPMSDKDDKYIQITLRPSFFKDSFSAFALRCIKKRANSKNKKVDERSIEITMDRVANRAPIELLKNKTKVASFPRERQVLLTRKQGRTSRLRIPLLFYLSIFALLRVKCVRRRTLMRRELTMALF